MESSYVGLVVVGFVSEWCEGEEGCANHSVRGKVGSPECGREPLLCICIGPVLFIWACFVGLS